MSGRNSSGQTLSDADALAYANSLLTRDQKIHDLRVKYLAKFQTVVPIRVAAGAVESDSLTAGVPVPAEVVARTAALG